MSIFVDTGVLYAAFDSAATRHGSGRTALETVLGRPEYGLVMTSEYVYDETVTLTYQRTGDMSLAIAVGQHIRGLDEEGSHVGPTLLYSSQKLFDATVETFERYSDHSLSFTDAMTLTMVDYHSVDGLLSFDDDFDGLTERLDPADISDET